MSTEFQADLRNLLPPAAIVVSETKTGFETDWLDEFDGRALAILRPESTQQVSDVMRLCARHGIAVVPQGGNTGLVGGAAPVAEGPVVILQLDRMHRLRHLDAQANTVTVEAGCVLTSLQEAARNADRLFPISPGSEGTAQIGGLISANAGGIMALRHGVMRDLVLGLEVVLPDGTIWSDLSALRKRNVGFDPKHLFIGSEGTLGIVTAACLRLVPRPKAHFTAWMALDSLDAAAALCTLAVAQSDGAVDACELIPRQGVDFALHHVPTARAPVDPMPDWSVLLELSGSDPGTLEATLMGIFETALEVGLVSDGILASNEAQRHSLWGLREAIVEGQRLAGPQLKHDVAVPVSLVAAFITDARAAVLSLEPAAKVSAFGHLGDGNIHFNLTLPQGADRPLLERTVYTVAMRHGGTLSAEHGLGRKKDVLAQELGAGHGFPIDLKGVIDPDNRLNPGCLAGLRP